jgi:HlyD family secretion protein
LADAPTLLKHRPWRWLIALVVLAALGTGAFVGHWQNRESNAPQWRTAVVSRGSIVASVSATGTLNAEVSVPVGSQVSGQIKEVLADFNAEVRRGQLIARIDPETFEYRVRQSQADVDAARAQVLTAQANISAATAAASRVNVNLAEARRDLDRKQQLVARNFISGAELDKARAVLDAVTEELSSARAQIEVAQAQAGSAKAVVAQREASLLAARADLERTAIRAPVDGIVIKRSIDAGQTVAASLQAPELFVIARNLRDMQVDTSIDEAEIGKIKVGQRATFTVDSYPGRSFSGTVKQVRKAALTVQNVVTYTVVVSTPNPDLALIPGMTANVRVVTDTRENVLKVPNAALRFRPPDWREPAPGAPANPPAPARSSALPGSFLLAWIAPAQAQGDSRPPPGAGGPSGQFRERLERDLALSADQKTKLDAIFSAQRETFRAAREAGEAERPKLAERNRAELRDRIADILNLDQKKKYAEIVAEIAGRQSTRGRVFVLDAGAGPRAVTVRTGLTDGAFTELSGEGIQEGATVIIGLQTSNSGAPKATAPAGPRLPF